ncbi:MAG: hypothetical protein KJT03_01150 [Verrucomicrobiae bacterium]|nr:hypothetical protein [Verrucomicrobiae bacterium]
MFEILIESVRTHILPGLMKGLAPFVFLCSGILSLNAQDILAYAKPKEDYNYIYTLDHEYETTLFRSEQFEPLAETEEGFVIMLQLGGKPKLVLLPFENGDRKIAEKKHRGVGVTYTAYLSFAEGHLPLFADRYYSVVKRDKGMLFIDYSLKGFQKRIEVPETQFIVKSAFEYHLEESLQRLRGRYHAHKFSPVSPENWSRLQTQAGPGMLTESPTHIGIVQKKILASNFQSIRTSPASDLTGAVDEVWVDQQRLIVVPIIYTHVTPDHIFYFVQIRGQDRPVLVKDFVVPEGSQGYNKIVRVSLNSGEDVRFLEISENCNVEYYPNFHFLSPGQLTTFREGYSAYYLIAPDGEYEISSENVELLYPANFLRLWANKTKTNQLGVEDKLYEELLKLQIPAVAKSSPEWQNIQKLQAVAHLNKKCTPEESANVQTLLSLLKRFEDGAERLQLSLLDTPTRTSQPIQNESFQQYWQQAFNHVNAQAARERNQEILNRQILRAKLLISETDNQSLIDFLSSQIYTYSNYLPAPLNRVNQLNTSPPLAATRLMVFHFPMEQSFKIQPDTLEPINLRLQQPKDVNRQFLQEEYNTDWELDLSILGIWQTSVISRIEEVHDPVYWQKVAEQDNLEKQRRLEIARKRLLAAQQAAAPVEGGGFLNSKEAPWVAAAIWLVVILMTNTGFFALAKAMPIKEAS